MKNILKFSILIFMLHSNKIIGQNLVPNPSFEDTMGCPSGLGGINLAVGWLSFTDSPDYYNSCSNVIGVPENPFGFQYAAEGNAYVGSQFCSPLAFPNVREYFGIQLQQLLQIGQKYFVSFKTVLSDPRGQRNCAINKLGAKFTTFYYHGLEGSTALITNSSQIYSNTIIDDSINWTLINGSFISDSAYKYIIIGDFFDDQDTDTLHCPTGGAYYYFDQICVSTDSITCNNFNGLIRINSNLFSLYPNPADDYFILKSSQIIKGTILIINSLGEVVFFKCNELIAGSYQISTEHLVTGIYEIRVVSNENEKYSKRILISH